MDDGEVSASEDGTTGAEQAANPSPTKPARRGRGRPRKVQAESSDNDSSVNGSQQVSSLKHVGKFRYLSKLNAADGEDESDPATKPLATSRGRGRGRGRGRPRGRGSANHVTTSLNHTEETSSHVSSRGRRIKPNNRWTRDSDFDSSPTKAPSGRGRRSSSARNAAARRAAAEEESTPEEEPSKAPEENEEEDDSAMSEPGTKCDSVDAPSVQMNGVDKEEVVETSASSPSAPSETLEPDGAVEEDALSANGDEQMVAHDDEDVTGKSEDPVEAVPDPEVAEQSPEVPMQVVEEVNGEVADQCLPSHVEDDRCTAQEITPLEDVRPLPTSADEPVENDAAVASGDAAESQDDHHPDATNSEKDEPTGALVESLRDQLTIEQQQMNSSSAENTPGEEEGQSPLLISPMPVKVKSRWRRTSELEQVVGRNGNSEQSSSTSSPLTMSPRSSGLPLRGEGKSEDHSSQAQLIRDDGAIVEERLKSFVHLEENLYLTSKSTSKEVKRMLCDCTLTKEESARGELGCGDDCINRLLMIECGPRCQLSSRCTNKRFQKRQYARIEVFNTEKKGVGLRSLQDLDPGDFIIEYIGEVIDPREFHRRAKEYARDKNKHYYFMALKNDAIIDATLQGNISRFINHSCDPNSETQKWTVNGELRIGFFVRKGVRAGEEITFDYQFQRYGKEAQRCYCESVNCRGWIGEDPEKEDKSREKRERRDREKKRRSNLYRDEVNNVDLEREIDKLSSSGVKNRTQTLTLSRLMVRAEDLQPRKNILNVLRKADQACRRLFLDYHGLKLLWGWMVDAASAGQNPENIEFKMDLLKTLSSLPVPNKTMLLDSKILSIVEKWAIPIEAPSSTAAAVPVVKKEETSEDPTDAVKDEVTDSVVIKQDPDDPPRQEPANPTQEPVAPADTNTAEAPSDKEDVEKVVTTASQLLESWSNLKEVFRIPKKERLEKMKEHEREADEHCTELSEVAPEEPAVRQVQSSYDRRPNNRLDTSGFKDPKDKMKRQRGESPERDNRKTPRLDFMDHLSKEERRRLFALRVAQQDEALRAKRTQEALVGTEVWKRHLEHCLTFGFDPTSTPINLEATPFIAAASPAGSSVPLPQMVWDPQLNAWQPCLEQETGLPSSVNTSALTPLSESSSSAAVKVPLEPPLLHLVLPKGYNPTSMGPLIMDFDSAECESSGVRYVPSSLAVPLPNEEEEDEKSEAADPPETKTSKLPRFWREAVDDRGRVFYYHVRMRLPQWEPPSPEDDTPDFSPDEEGGAEEEGKEEDAQVETTAEQPVIEDPKWQERLRRRNLLCREKIINPRSDFERSEDAQRYRELKERILRLKLVRIRERGFIVEEPRPRTAERVKSSSSSRNRDKRKLSEKEKEKLRKRAKEKHKRSLQKADLRKKHGPAKEGPKVNVDHSAAAPAPEPAPEEVQVNGIDKPPSGEREEPAVATEKEQMDGSMDDDMLLNLNEGEDEAGEKERNKDVSANTVRKIKDAFRLKISSDIVNILNPYRRPDCKLGRISCNDDFKHLARKMTHFVLAKELKHCRNIEELVVNDSVKHKAKDFIKKYMTKFGPVYKRGTDDDI